MADRQKQQLVKATNPLANLSFDEAIQLDGGLVKATRDMASTVVSRSLGLKSGAGQGVRLVREASETKIVFSKEAQALWERGNLTMPIDKKTGLPRLELRDKKGFFAIGVG